MITVKTNFNYPTEVLDVVKLFFSDVVIGDGDVDVVHAINNVEGEIVSTCTYNGTTKTAKLADSNDNLHSIRLSKRVAKMSVYDCLSVATGINQPWGSLTGIRPTKLAYQLRDNEGCNYQDVFEEQFGVSTDKINLVGEILQQQQGLRIINDGIADMYLSVPFCATRCSYCSFTSGEIGKLRKYVDSYVETLIYDIRSTLAMAKNMGLNINNVYFGGGTPTTLSAEQLDRVLDEIDFVPNEYNVEAGRPDTIDKEKLDVFAKHGVNRISINPQTFSNSVLQAVGRNHTMQDVVDCYYMARQFDFDINMDFIAGLPTDTLEGFCASIDKAIELRPDNITVHTLAYKQKSILGSSQAIDNGDMVKQMVDYARAKLNENGYSAYYMYRQKYMRHNLENVGYCLSGKQGRYNINMMEETNNILACGANGISKRVFGEENRIERSANAKDVISYINNIDTYLGKKSKLFG